MHRPPTSDQADLTLLAILFFFLVLFSASKASGDNQKTEQRHYLPQAVATTSDAVVKGRAI